MNKTFRSVWNARKQTYVAAAESVSARGKPCSGTQLIAAMSAAIGVLVPNAHAQTAPAPDTLPTGGQLSAGQAAIRQSGANMVIQQSSDRAAINWQTFNVGQNAHVQFQQPGSSSVTLNRVTSADPSQIFGRISANGQVILTNPSGVYFGRSARVDVGGLVATTNHISDSDFMAGNNRYERNGSTGSVVNEGELKASLGGYIALLAPEVRNHGAIIAQRGTVALAAGEAVDLHFDSNNRLTSIRVEAAEIETLVDNRHAVEAPGGLIIISAQSMDRLVGGVVKNSGRIEANGLQQQGGRIILSASKQVDNSGTIAADATQSAITAESGPAGQVEINAPEVLNRGSIRANGVGQQAAGTVRIEAERVEQKAPGSIRAEAPVRGGQIDIQASEHVLIEGVLSVAAPESVPVSTESVPVETEPETPAQGEGGFISIEAAQISLETAVIDASGLVGGTIRMHASGHESVPGTPEQPSDPREPGRLAILGNSTISARGRGSYGGVVTLTGDDIGLLDNTRIDATGASGGGTVLVGGDWQGSNDVYQATAVKMADTVSIDASATRNGDGGMIVLWSDINNPGSTTTTQGALLAKGGAEGGKGGKVETSGAHLVFDGVKVDTQASDGSAGEWLLDPYNFFLNSTDLATISSNLSGANISISTASASGGGVLAESLGSGHLVLESDFNYSGSAYRTLTLTADKDIWVDGNISATGSGALGVTFNAAGDRVLLNGNISTGGGSVTFNTSAVHFQKQSGDQSISTSGGDLVFGAANLFLLKQPLTGAVTLNSGSGALSLGSGSVQHTTNFHDIVSNLLLSSWGGAKTGTDGVVSYNINIVAGREYAARLYFWDSWDGERGEIHVRKGDGTLDYYFASERNFSSGFININVFNNGAIYQTSDPSYLGRTAGFIDQYVDVAFVAKNSGTLTTWTNLNQGIDDESLELFGVRETYLTADSSYSSGGRSLTLASSTGQISGTKNFAGLDGLTVSTDNNTSVLGGVVSGATSVTKTGSGTLTLTANQTYTGATAINAGTLVLSNNTPTKGTSGFSGAGALRIEPASMSFTSGFSTLGWSFGSSLGGLTIGTVSNTANVTVPEAITISGPLAIFGGRLDVQQSLTAAGAITLKATSTDVLLGGTITNTASSATALNIEAGRHIRVGSNASITSSSAPMSTQLWADTDRSGDGIVYFESSGIDTRGGTLTFGKSGQTASIGGRTVLVGGDVFFQRDVGGQTLSTGGGALTIHGETMVANTAGLTLNTAGGAVFLEGVLNSANQYQSVSSTSSWEAALTAAKSGSGSSAGDTYLATITSRLENSIAALTVNYNTAWLGARRVTGVGTDASWRWVAGPEGLQDTYGLIFATQSTNGGVTSVNNAFNNWSGGEPNNWTGNTRGDFAYEYESALQFTGNQGLWNDLPNRMLI